MARQKNRRVSLLYPNKYYLFICEDEKSMRYYLNGLRPYLKSGIKLEAKHSNRGQSAEQVFRCAMDCYKEIKERKDAYPKGFNVIACFDKDNNPIEVVKGLMQKQKNNFSISYNNPCYEFWLFLHFVNASPVFSSSDECAHKCLQEFSRRYGSSWNSVDKLKQCKHIFEVVKNELFQALENAKKQNFDNYEETFTNTHILIEEIVDLEKIRK